MGAKEEEVKLCQSIDAVLQTEEGRTVFGYLFKTCGYNQRCIVVNHNREVQIQSTIHDEARRGVYVELRRKATPALIAFVENAIEAAQWKAIEMARQKAEEAQNKKEETN